VVRWYSDSLRNGRTEDRVPVEARFSAPVQTSPDVHPAPYSMGLSRGQSGRGVALITQPTSSAKFKERVQLYLYSPYGD